MSYNPQTLEPDAYWMRISTLKISRSLKKWIILVLCVLALAAVFVTMFRGVHRNSRDRKNGYLTPEYGKSIEYVYVNTSDGTVKGLKTELAKVFYGIPYAEPPVGDFRWRFPQNVQTWAPNILDATKPKPWCLQSQCAPGDTYFRCPPQVSEDCLYLNIWTPLTETTSPLPVMLFIHGGAFIMGGSTMILYDGRFLVSKGQVVYVSINYRLGALAFLRTGERGEENFGIEDQSMAMRWVQTNIHHFGGDRNKVTLFGQSAGAHSVMIHMTKPDSENYFQNAIIESLPLTVPLKSPPEASYITDIFAGKIGCTFRPALDMKCLRSKTADQIVIAQVGTERDIVTLRCLVQFQPWEPWIDSKVVPHNPLNALEVGAFSKKSVIIGSVTEDARLFIYSAYPNPISTETYLLIVEAVVMNPFNVRKMLDYYPLPPHEDKRDILSTFATDYVFGCSARHASRLFVSKGTNLWLYTFGQTYSFRGAWRNFPFCEDHVCHGTDLPFVFQTHALVDFHFSDDEIALSDFISEVFTNFAKTSNPNGLSGTSNSRWLPYTESNKWSSLFFEAPESKIVQNYRSWYCDFNDKVGYLPF